MSPKQAGYNLGEENMLNTPYALFFQLQESSPQENLYDFLHYSVLRVKSGNQQWPQHKVRQVSQALACISLSLLIALSNVNQVNASAYTNSIPYHQTASSAM
ncbi:hypothetical protein TNCV_2960461 [Trichonephila clavipes]|nr:hypothetical protein TNCV_2960461 [Trichonephila clavipes]